MCVCDVHIFVALSLHLCQCCCCIDDYVASVFCLSEIKHFLFLNRGVHTNVNWSQRHVWYDGLASYFWFYSFDFQIDFWYNYECNL